MLIESSAAPAVFSIFEELSRIPRGSFHIDAVSDWLVAFAESHGLQAIQDADKNVIVIKQADPGFEDVPGLILQGHMDMVCAKETGSTHDFTKDPLALYVEDGFLKAKETTLGADDGIAIAYALAVMTDPDVKSGRLEAVFTVNEEVGLLGAESLDTSLLTGTSMINIDSSEEGSITAGCAGGMTASVDFDMDISPSDVPAYRLTVSGLNGGHSGEQIHEGLANANLILKDLLRNLYQEVQIRLVSIQGGVADNAIPASAEALIRIPDEEHEKAEKCIATLQNLLRIRYAGIDDHIMVTLQPCSTDTAACFSDDSVARLLQFLSQAPNGVIKMSEDMEGLVETSLNLGTIRTEGAQIQLLYSLRSSVDADKEALYEHLAILAANQKGKPKRLSAYPGWKFNKDSKLQSLFREVYRSMYGKELAVRAIHAGLECGIFSGKMPGLDCVSMGPDVFDLHTTGERMSVASAERCYLFLKEIIRKFSAEIKH